MHIYAEPAILSQALPAFGYIQPQDINKEAHFSAPMTVKRTQDTGLHDPPRSRWLQAALSPGHLHQHPGAQALCSLLALHCLLYMNAVPTHPICRCAEGHLHDLPEAPL